MKVAGKILKYLLILAIIGGLGYGGYMLYQSRTSVTATATPSYTQAVISKGDLQKTVTGTGSLSISEKHKLTIDFDVQLDEVLVQVGEQVSEGTPIAKINQDALQTTIDTLNTEIADLDTSMATLGSSYSDTETVKASVSGRVKEIYGKVGMLTKDAIQTYGGLVLLSVDGMMQVTVETDDLKVGDSVKVVEDKYTYTGAVEKVQDGRVTITFPDTRTLKGATVRVVLNGIELGQGEADIHLPYICSSTVDGYIATNHVTVNSVVSKKGKLSYITNIPQSSEYKKALKQRDEKLKVLSAAQKIQLSGVIISPVDGIINTVLEASNDSIMAKTEIASIYVGNKMQMVISVDELDISGVKAGQAVSIAMDSVTDKTYTGTVAHISQIGTASSGVTTYSVTLDVNSDERLKMGMNGTSTIVVDEVKDVVLVPISALYSSRNRQYVWLYSETSTAEGGPGVMTFVETGFSNDNYAEVISGLKEGDVVMILRSATDGASNMAQREMMMNFGGNMGEGSQVVMMPAEGFQPGQNFNRQNQGGGQRPGN